MKECHDLHTKNVSDLVEKTDKLMVEFVKIRVMMEMLLEKSVPAIETSDISCNPSKGDELDFKFPATSKDALEELENRLRSEPIFKTKLVRQF